jgi:hypothetical protein
MSYKRTASDDQIIRLADGAAIPRDVGNADYRAWLIYTQAGGVTAPADPPAPAQPSDLDALLSVLAKKGVATQADIDAAKARGSQ